MHKGKVKLISFLDNNNFFAIACATDVKLVKLFLKVFKINFFSKLIMINKKVNRQTKKIKRQTIMNK